MITKEAEALKAGLDVAGENRQWWLEAKIFPYIRHRDPFGVRELCEHFEIEISEYQVWKWLLQMPEGHIGKIRRRIEDYLRKSTPREILKMADSLGIKTDSEPLEASQCNNFMDIIFKIPEPGALYDTDGTLEIPTFPENIWVNHPTRGQRKLQYVPAKEGERTGIIFKMRSLGHFVVTLCFNGVVGIYADMI